MASRRQVLSDTGVSALPAAALATTLVNIRNASGFPRSRAHVLAVESQDQEIPFHKLPYSFLPYGLGRSYGDVCLNDGQALLATRGLNRVIAFDESEGRLTAEAGMSFDAILALIVPRGWFLPVSPGTRFVTLGGAVANDVHGKNHHRAGTFGNHVLRFQLRRSDGSRLVCSPRGPNADWFRATVGGLGLTGLIEWVEVQLKPIVNSWVDCETIRYRDLDEFEALDEDSTERYEYIASWVDAVSRRRPGRGVYIRGNHNCDPERKQERDAPAKSKLAVPVDLPFSVLSRGPLTLFNAAYYYAKRDSRARVPLAPFFYPLDVVDRWDRLYGRRGMVQWQGLIPLASRDLARDVFACAAQAGGSYLVVMKVMGDIEPAGLLSFSGAGVTIALDFPYRPGLLPVLARLEAMLVEAGGRMYPAKDATMSGRSFRRFYPQWEAMLPYIDPRFSSSFWRRVTAA